MGKKIGARYVRDRVSGYGKNVTKATDKEFGINKSLIMRAVMGDDAALRQIGDMGQTGDRLQLAMPVIRDRLKSYIEGTVEYNTALADILVSGGKGAIAVQKAGGAVSLEDARYSNQFEEAKAQLFENLKFESDRHGDAMDIISLNAWISSMMIDENQRVKIESITNKPFVAQQRADIDYEQKKALELLEMGSNADLSLIPRKHYATNPAVRVWNYVRDLWR